MGVVDQHSGAISTDDLLVPGWLARLAAIGWRVLVTLAFGLVVWAIVVLLFTVAASIIVAMILAATLAPYVIERRARGWGRAKAAGVVSLAGLLVLGATVGLIVVAIVPSLREIVAAFDAGIAAAIEQLAVLGVPADVTATLQHIAGSVRGIVLGGLGEFVSAAANVVTIAILGGFLTYFLLVDGDRAWDWLLASTDGWRQQALMSGGVHSLNQVGGYIRGTAVMAAATAVMAGLLMLVLGVPFAGPLAVVALLGSFVPYIGRALVALLISTITLTTRGAVPASLLLMLFVLGSIALDRALARVESGRHLELHPIPAVLGLPMGFAIGGFGGLIVIMPLLATAQTWAGVLTTALGQEPTAAPKGSTTSAMVPVWLDRLAQWSWRALIVAALFGVVAQTALLFPGVIMPVVIAVILAATLEPAAAALQRRGISPGLAAMVVTVGTGIVIVGVLFLTLTSLVSAVADVTSTASAGAENSGAEAIGVGSFVAAIGSGLLAVVTGAVANIIGVVVVLLLGGFLTYYFIRYGARVWDSLTARLPEDRRRPLDAAGSRAASVLGGYMLGTAAISLFGAVSQWVIMVVLGLPYALPLAVLAVFAGFIPYIGGFVATGLAFLVAVAVGDSTDILIMGIYTLVFNIIQGNFVTPLVYGKAVSLHPAIILLAVPIGSALAGIVGMFLVVPVAGVIATTWRAVLQMIDTSGAPEPEPPAIGGAGDEVGPAVSGLVVGG